MNSGRERVERRLAAILLRPLLPIARGIRREVLRLIELGISEIGVYYPRRREQIPTFERIAQETIPALKAKYRQ